MEMTLLVLVLFTCRVIIPYFLPKVKSLFLFFPPVMRKIISFCGGKVCADMTREGFLLVIFRFRLKKLGISAACSMKISKKSNNFIFC